MRFLTFLMLISVVAADPARAQDHPDLDGPARMALQSISADSLFAAVQFLGSDALAGRGTGTKGGDVAATWIARRLRESGLHPAGSASTWYQRIPMHGSRALEESELRVHDGETTLRMALQKDFVVYQGGAETQIPQPAGMVFVGYGIHAPEYDYNDYGAVDVEGRIVVMLEGEPYSTEPDYFQGGAQSRYSSPELKQRTALANGAVGSIMIADTGKDIADPWRQRALPFSFESITLYYTRTSSLNLLLRPGAAEHLFAGSGYTLDELYDMRYLNTIRSFQLTARASFRGRFQERDFVSSNVAAVLPGRDPDFADEWVIISAHYDHLGIGPPVAGDSIYNGVFDNAAGTAALLELARVFASLPEPPRRSMLFLFLTGEEHGLLGSIYYTDHPLVPISKSSASINVDGLALFEKSRDVVAIGEEYSNISTFVRRAASQLGLTVSQPPELFRQSNPFLRSDHAAFSAAGIPSLLLMEGSDYETTDRADGLLRLLKWGAERYHTPFDDLSQDMNFDAGRWHAQVIFALAWVLANSDEAVSWHPGSPFINARLRAVSEGR